MTLRTNPKPHTNACEEFAAVLSKMSENHEVIQSGDDYQSQILDRPPLVSDDPQDSIVFQVTRVEEGNGPNNGAVHVFGLTKEGATVLATVYDHVQSFYIECPKDFTDKELKPFLKHMNDVYHDTLVTKVDRVRMAAVARGRENWLLKFDLKDASRMQEVKEKLEKGLFKYKTWFIANWNLTTYETNVSYLSSFIRTHQIHTLSWVEVKSGTHKPKEEQEKNSTCQLETTILDGHSLKVLSTPEVESRGLPRVAPLRVLAFDLETTVPRTNTFPDPTSCQIIQISSVLTHRYGPENVTEGDPFMRIIFTHKQCDPIEGAQVLSFDTEKEMMEHWRKFILYSDPDLVLSYNGCRFDLPFYLARASRLGCPELGQLGRLNDACLRWTPWNTSTNNVMWSSVPIIPGRITFDLLDYANRKEPSPRRLGDLSQRVLHETKVDMPFTEITPAYERGPDGRREVAVYCLKDAYLLHRLFDHLQCLEKSAADAQALSIPMEWMMTRWVRDKLMFNDIQKGFQGGYIVPDRQYPPPLQSGPSSYF